MEEHFQSSIDHHWIQANKGLFGDEAAQEKSAKHSESASKWATRLNALRRKDHGLRLAQVDHYTKKENAATDPKEKERAKENKEIWEQLADEAKPTEAEAASESSHHLQKRAPVVDIHALHTKFAQKEEYHYGEAVKHHDPYFRPGKGMYDHAKQGDKWEGRRRDLESNDPERMLNQANQYHAKEVAKEYRGLTLTAKKYRKNKEVWQELAKNAPFPRPKPRITDAEEFFQDQTNFQPLDVQSKPRTPANLPLAAPFPIEDYHTTPKLKQRRPFHYEQ